MISITMDDATPLPERKKRKDDRRVDKRISIALAKTKKKLFQSKRKLKSKQIANRKAVLRFLESKKVILFMLIPIMYLLFIDDFVTSSACAQTAELVNGIGVTKVIIFFVFIAELSLTLYARRKDYYFSIMFLLDLISIASLIPDVVGYVFGVTSISTIHSLAITRTARAARVATRLARLPRLLEMLEFRKKQRVKIEATAHVEPSKTGSRLVARIGVKVVIIVLLLLLCVTLLTPGTDVTPYAVAGLRDLEVLESVVGFNSSVFAQVLQSYTSQYDPVLYLKLNGRLLINQQSRIARTQPVYSNVYYTSRSSVLLLDPSQQLQAGLSIVETVCVIIILAGGTLFMTRDALVLVIRPLEKMLGLMKVMTAATAAKGHSSTTNTYEEDSGSDDDDDNEGDDAAGAADSGVSYESGLDSDSYDDEADHLVDMVDLLAQARKASLEEAKQADTIERGIKLLQNAARSFLARRNFINLTKQIGRRNQIFQEMLTTERSYVSSLSVLINEFEKPLRSVLSAEQISLIFSNIQRVLEYNQIFLQRLEGRARLWAPHAVVGDIFETLENMAGYYSEFINNYNNAVEFVKKCLQNSEVAAVLKACVENPAVHGLDIFAYLIMPIQRSPRYVMLVEQMLKFTPEHHQDYALLKNAFEVVKQVAADINERKRDSENQAIIHGYYMRMEPPVPQLMKPGTTFLHEGNLIEEGEEFLCLLFNNVFLKCVMKEDNILVKLVLPVNTLTSAIGLANSAQFGICNAFQISTTSEQHILVAGGTIAKHDWMTKLDKIVSGLHPRRKSAYVASS